MEVVVDCSYLHEAAELDQNHQKLRFRFQMLRQKPHYQFHLLLCLKFLQDQCLQLLDFHGLKALQNLLHS
jgi:hypothetical protein